MQKWVGLGGWKCRCCGPKPKDHQLVRRRARRVMNDDVRKLNKEYA